MEGVGGGGRGAGRLEPGVADPTAGFPAAERPREYSKYIRKIFWIQNHPFTYSKVLPRLILYNKPYS